MRIVVQASCSSCRHVRLGRIQTGEFLLIGQRSVVVQTGWPHAGDARPSRPSKQLWPHKRRRLRSSEKRLNYRSLSHKARDENLSLAVLQGVGPLQVGLYPPSVLGRWPPLLPNPRLARVTTRHPNPIRVIQLPQALHTRHSASRLSCPELHKPRPCRQEMQRTHCSH